MKADRGSAWQSLVRVSRNSALLALLAILATATETAWAGINEWTSLGPEDASIQALAIDPQNSDTIYAGGTGGVFKSTDGGASWSAVNSGLPTNPDGTYAGITVLVIDPQNPSTVYAAKPNWVPVGRRDFADVGAPVFKTMDGGASWSAASSGLPGNIFRIDALVIDPQNPTTVYVAIRIQDFPFTGARADLFKSTDGGDSWSAASSGLPANYAERLLAIDPQNPSILYAAATLCMGNCDSQLFESADGGRTWNALPFLFRSNGNYWGSIITSLAVDPQNSDTVYVMVDEMDDMGRIAKTTDGGTSWNWITGWSTYFTYSLLVVDPKNSSTLYAGFRGGGGIFKSGDGGTSWSLLRSGLPEKTYFSSLVIDPQNPNTLYAGTTGGVFTITFVP